MLAAASLKTVILAFGITASGFATETGTCQKLEGLYQANVDTVGAALQAFEQCTSIPNVPNSCSSETRDLVIAREELQAAFMGYLKTCGSRLARRGSETGSTSRTLAKLF